MPREVSKNSYLLLAIVLVGANIFIYQGIFASPILKVSVFDTGKGRAALMRAPSGATVLVDTGPDAGILRMLGDTLPPWRRSIDTVVLTSGDANAVGGLPEVLKRYRVSNIIRFGAEGSRSLEASLVAALDARGMPEPSRAPYGARLTFDDTVSVDVISPGTFRILHGTTDFLISSSTTPGVYASDGSSVLTL